MHYFKLMKQNLDLANDNFVSLKFAFVLNFWNNRWISKIPFLRLCEGNNLHYRSWHALIYLALAYMNLSMEVYINKGLGVSPLHLPRPQESQACVSCGVRWRQGLWGWHPAVSSVRVPAAASEWQEHTINIKCMNTISKLFMQNRQFIHCVGLWIPSSQISITVRITFPYLNYNFQIFVCCVLHSLQTAPKISIEQMKLRTSCTASMQQITQSFRRIWVLNSISFHKGTREKVSECLRMREQAIFKKHSPQVKSSHPSRQWQSQPCREGWTRRGLHVLCSPARSERCQAQNAERVLTSPYPDTHCGHELANPPPHKNTSSKNGIVCHRRPH